MSTGVWSICTMASSAPGRSPGATGVYCWRAASMPSRATVSSLGERARMRDWIALRDGGFSDAMRQSVRMARCSVLRVGRSRAL